MNDLATCARAYLPTAVSNLTIRQIAILGLVCDEPDAGSTKDIAGTLRVPKAVVTRSIRAFERLGLVTSRPSKADLRLRIIAPTEAGIALRASFRNFAD